MSTVAASAAAVAHPRSEFIGNSVGGTRRRLRSVPAQAGSVVPLEVGNPLQLTKTMRERLLAAVRALLSDPALKGADDPVRLAAVVLMAKAKVSANYSTRITATELGRWIGLKQSRVAHHVLPQLRERGVLGSNETVSEAGRMTGLECWVIPMYRAQHGGDRRHVLALSRVELVVLLKLIEVLFAPGWEHKDGRTTPAGMLADRTGRGAATDRLGLLLMVLSSNTKGWLQLCSGSVDTERGRPAATVARLLGCSPAGGAKVLSRLQERDVLSVDRRETASGLNARSRVRLLPVARAHGVAVREVREAADAVFSDLAGTASGDHEAAGEAVSPVVTGVQGARKGVEAGTADRADAAHLHASHAPVVTPVPSLSLSGCFSGEGRGGNRRRPDRAYVREDQAVDGGPAVVQLAPPMAEGGPLRGEKPKEFPADERDGRRADGAGAGDRPKTMGWEKAQRRRAGLPADLRLRVVLGPVAGLWERLSGWQQDQVEAAAKAELSRLAGLLEQSEAAPRLLADRLIDRLEEVGGQALVRDPMGWLLGRGLVQRQACMDLRCDDGIRLDTRADCPTCTSVIADRRGQRARLRAVVDEQLAGAGAAERRAVYEQQLREHTLREAARAEARRAREAAAVQARQTVAARRRAQQEAAAQARRSAPCAECGLPDAAGLCPQCTHRQRIQDLLGEAVDLAVAVRADLDDPDDTARLTERCAADTHALLTKASQHSSAPELQSLTEREVADRILAERRTSALKRLLRSEEADAEAAAVYEMVLRRRPTAYEAAQEAAEQARCRTAQYLLQQRLGQLRVLRIRTAAGRLPQRNP